MLGAKLFAIGAVAIALIAFLPLRLTTAIDIHLRDTYFVIGPHHALLGSALLFSVFACFYYLGDRILGLPLNANLTLAHFLSWLFACAVLSVEVFGLIRAVLRGQDANQSWLLMAGGVAPLLLFIVGGILFLTNLARAIVLKLKTA